MKLKFPSKLNKTVAAIAASTVLLAGVAGCGTGGGSSTANASSGDSGGSSAGKPVELTFLFAQYDDKTQGLMQQVVDDFNKQYQGKIHVTLETAPWSKMHQKLITMMSANQAPDVYEYATRWLSQFINLKQLQPLNTLLSNSPTFNDQFIPSLLNGAKLPNQSEIYGLPAAASARMLFYRKDLFKKAGLQPPKTWAELLQDAQKINNPPNTYGIGIYASGIEVDTYFDYFLWNNGGHILSPNGKAALNSPQGVQALQFMIDLAKKYKVTEPNPNGFTRDQIIQMFLSGQIGMYPTGPWLSSEIKSQNPKLQYGISYFPSKDGGTPAVMGVTDSLGISANSTHQADAWKFVQFMYQPQYRLKFDKVEGMLPVEKSVAQNPFFQTPDMKPFVDGLSYAKFYPMTPNFPSIEQIETVAVQQAMSGQMTPKQALDQAAQKIDALGN